MGIWDSVAPWEAGGFRFSEFTFILSLKMLFRHLSFRTLLSSGIRFPVQPCQHFCRQVAFELKQKQHPLFEMTKQVFIECKNFLGKDYLHCFHFCSIVLWKRLATGIVSRNSCAIAKAVYRSNSVMDHLLIPPQCQHRVLSLPHRCAYITYDRQGFEGFPERCGFDEKGLPLNWPEDLEPSDEETSQLRFATDSLF